MKRSLVALIALLNISVLAQDAVDTTGTVADIAADVPVTDAETPETTTETAAVD